MKSPTPIMHEEHVRDQHIELRGFCPYCQDFLLGNRPIEHLKFCCFFHKIENTKYRRIFNISNKKNQQCESIIKTSVLTLQYAISDSHYLLNMLQYENYINTDKYYYGSYNKDRFIDCTPLPINDQSKYDDEIRILNEFFYSYTLAANRFPLWWDFDWSEIKDHISVLVANNQLTFNEGENIDCRLVRIVSLHWYKFDLIKYTISCYEFIRHIEKFKECIDKKYFIITRYIQMFKYNDIDALTINMIIIKKKNEINFYWNEIMSIAKNVSKIENFDNFIDCCFDFSNDYSLVHEFPESETLSILIHNDKNNLLISNYQTTLNMSTKTNVTKSKNVFNKFFSPLSMYAKVYFYSQTYLGCVRAFDRLLNQDNLANYITDVIYDRGIFYINYSSIKIDGTTKGFFINLNEGEVFADETYHKQHEFDYKQTTLKGEKIFFFNKENLKLVKTATNTNELQKHVLPHCLTPSKANEHQEFLLFPHCLTATNIRYKLTPFQVVIFNVAQYHREKTYFEFYNVPNFESI